MRLTARLIVTSLVILMATIAGASETTDSAAVAEQRDAARDRYLRLMAEGRNAEAVAAGQEVVDLTRQLFGAGSRELGSPLTNLATAQLRSGQLEAAATNYQEAIALLEKGNGFLSPQLINPLVGLGETAVRSEQYAVATQAFERALRVNHVNDGFYNLEQLPIRDGLTEGHLGQRDIEKANFHQEAQIYVQQRKLGRENPELVGPLTKLGRWYDRTGQTEAARLVYQGAARLVEKVQGENSPGMVEPLLAIAATYRQQALLPPDPDSNQSPDTLLPLSSMMLRKALGIVQNQDPPDAAQRARILVELGDLYMMWGKQNTASDRYQEAWQALSAGPELEVRRDELFAQPARIMGPVLPAIYPVPARKAPLPAPKDLEPGFVVLRFDVDELGRVTAATVVESEPINLLEERARATAKRTLYRPRYVDGKPVPATGLILRHEFRYAPKKLEKESEPPSDQRDEPLEQPGA